MNSKWLTPGEAAKELGVHPATLRRWVEAGRLPGTVQTPGGHLRLVPEEVDRLRGKNGLGQALLYLRVGDESERRFLDLGLAHLTRCAVERGYSVARVVSEVGAGFERPGLDELRAEIQHGKQGYEAILVERADRLLIAGGGEFIAWAAPAVRVQVMGASCPEADAAYRRELLLDLFYPLADALALRGVPPARAEAIIARGLDGIAEALGLVGGGLMTARP